MVAGLALTNWTGTWSAAQKALTPALVSCSVAMKAPPVPGARQTVIGTQAAVELWDGEPAGAPGDFKYDVATEARALGYDLFPMVGRDGFIHTGARFLTFDDGHTSTYALNLTRPEVCRWFAARFVEHFPWADGWHADYWTNLAWIDQKDYVRPVGGDAFWLAYQNGLTRIAREIRGLRSPRPTRIIGQQFHNMRGAPDMAQLSERYVEDYPWKWGWYRPWQKFHGDQIDAFAGFLRAVGNTPEHVIELRYPLAYTAYERQSILDFAGARGCLVSWGRDRNAGAGWAL